MSVCHAVLFDFSVRVPARVCFVLWVGPAGLFRCVPDLGKGLSRVVFDLVRYFVRTSF